MKIKFAAFLVLSVLLVSGCVSQYGGTQTGGTGTNQTTTAPPSAPGIKEFSMTIGHTFYNPSTITVNKGDTVRIMAVSATGTGLESGVSHNHGITIDEYNINVAIPSETRPVVISFVADKTGTFSIYCKTCWDGPFGREHPDIRATLVVNP